MAVYTKLLLNSGEGIRSTRQQVRPVENTVSILIGLGGTGIDCIKTIKAAVKERLWQEYPYIRFLGVDSDESKFRNRENTGTGVLRPYDLRMLDDTEILDISAYDIGQVLRNPGYIKMRPDLQWLNCEEIPIPGLGGAGAGGTRQIGRYLFMDHSVEFLGKMEEMICTAKNRMENPEINIHIFAGLSGGTGSGAFLDACYLAKEAAKEYGGATVSGYFFLPEVNLERVYPGNPYLRAQLEINACAAMKELDYCMRLEQNGGAFTQIYKDGKEIVWEQPPADICHMIGSADRNTIPDPYDYALNVAAEHVLHLLTEPEEGHFSLREDLEQRRAKIKQTGEDASPFWMYDSIGASCAEIPLKEINTCLLSGMFVKFKDIRTHEPEDYEIKNIAAAAKLDDYKALRKELLGSAGEEYTAFPGTWKDVRDRGNIDMIKHYADQTVERREIIKANAQRMCDEGNSSSLIARMRFNLERCLLTVNYGPFFVYRMLESAREHNLLNIIDEMLRKNEAYWHSEKAQDYDSDCQKAREEFFAAPDFALLKKKKYVKYEQSICRLEQQKINLEICKQLDWILRDFKNRVKGIAENYRVLQRVLGNILDTFEENNYLLEAGWDVTDANYFAKPLVTIAELRAKIEAELEEEYMPGLMWDFLNYFLNHELEWRTEEEYRIVELVSAFRDTAYTVFNNKTITAFLQDKYSTTDNGVIADRVYRDFIKDMAEEAEPLFVFDSSVWEKTKTENTAEILVPGIAAPVVDAAKTLRERNPLYSVKERTATDRILLLRTTMGFPLGAYFKCGEYEHEYSGSRLSGCHIYEWKQLGFSGEQTAPLLLTPESLVDYEKIPKKCKKQLEESRKLYDSAKDAGLIKENVLYRLKEADGNLLSRNLEQAERAVTNQIAKRGFRKSIAEEKIRQLKQEFADIRMEKSGYTLAYDYCADIEEIRRDFFISSPVFQEMVKADLEVLDKLKAGICRLEEIVGRAAGEEEIEEFCHVLFSGIFEWKSGQIVYHREEADRMTEIGLSDSKAAFQGVPLYRAFVSYQAMATEEKQQIVSEAGERLCRMDPRAEETLLKLKMCFNSQYRANMEKNAGDCINSDEIKVFLEKVYMELEDEFLKRNI